MKRKQILIAWISTLLVMLFQIQMVTAAQILGTGSISGTIINHADNSPIEDVRIRLYQGTDVNIADQDAGDYVGSTYTEQNGFYQLSDLDERRYRLRVRDQYVDGTPYFETNIYNVQVLEGANTPNMDFTLRQAAVIYGYVKTADDTPLVAKLSTETAFTHDGEEWHTWNTDINGRYEFLVAPSPGMFYPIHVRKALIPGKGYRVYGGSTMLSWPDGKHPEQHGYDLLGSDTITNTFSGTYSCYAIVVDVDHLVKVDAIEFSDVPTPSYWSTGNTPDWRNARDAPDGQYASVGIGGACDGGYIIVEVSGNNSSIKIHVIDDLSNTDPIYYETKWDGNFYQATLEGTQASDYILEPAGAITGRVVNENSVGVEDVRVELMWNDKGRNGRVARPLVNTDQNGDFTLNCVPTGENYIFVNNLWRETLFNGVKYMVGQAYKGPITLNAGETIDAGTFTIYEAGRITGIVTSTDGNPIVGVRLELRGYDIDGNWSRRDGENNSVTDAFGQYTIDYIPPGKYSMYLWRDGFAMKRVRNIFVNKGGHVQEIDIILQNADESATISGIITNYDEIASFDSNSIQFPYYIQENYSKFGNPTFLLIVVDSNDNRIGRILSYDIQDGYGDYFEPSNTETPGAFNSVVPPGDIRLALWVGYSDDFSAMARCSVRRDYKRFDLLEGDVLENIEFTAITPDTGTVTGAISVPEGYDYLPDGWCDILLFRQDTGGSYPDAHADPGITKRYEMRNVPEGTYILKADARNLAWVIYSSLTVTAGNTTTQDITFTAGGTLTGRITDGAGPIEGARIRIKENGKQDMTDASGNYSIPGINTGNYTIEVSASGYADEETTVSITSGSATTQDFILNSNVGSISGTVKDDNNNDLNGVTIVAYNETEDDHWTAETVAGEFTFSDLTPGEYILAVNTLDHGVVVYPSDGSRITLSPQQIITGINITAQTIQPPVFTVTSSVSSGPPAIITMEFISNRELNADPLVSIVEGGGTLGNLIVNQSKNRFETMYTADGSDTIVRIKIEETDPLVIGNPTSKTFTFELGSGLVQTSSTNVTNATGGNACIMGTQDNTEIYVPPFAVAGADDTQALTMTIERYGDPGDPVTGTNDQTVSAVYDFHFDQGGVTVDTNHTFTVTMSFQLPQGMSQEDFEDSLDIRYFDAGDQQWKTDGISNVRINWSSMTIMFEVSHLTRFAAFVLGAPTITTGSATSVTTNSATLHGTVNPNGASTTYYFEYGTDTDYGLTTPSTDAGSGTSDVSVSADITGLSASTTYHFRLAATNSGGTSYGDDATFTTTTAPAPAPTDEEGEGGADGGFCFISVINGN